MFTITIASSLHPQQVLSPDEEIKQIIAKYVSKIPDVPPKYVINDGLTTFISKYFNNKINTFPLYKISLKIDRKPVKIPWTLGSAAVNATNGKKKYTYVKIHKENVTEKKTSSN